MYILKADLISNDEVIFMITVQAIGRLTKDPILKEIVVEKETINICEFTLACYTSKDKTSFIKVNAVRGLGEYFFENFYKGQKVLITGDLYIPPYDKKNKKQYPAVLYAKGFDYAERKEMSKSDNEPEIYEENNDEYEVIDDDDLFIGEEEFDYV